MEEKKPLESRSLKHTSKEPEAQVWAQIGTSSYDPPIKPAPAIATTDKASTSKENGVPTENTTSIQEEEATEAAQEPQKEAENGKDKVPEEKKSNSPPKRKSNTLGDGFETTESESKPKRSRSRSRSRSRERRRRSRSTERRDYSTSSMNQKDIRSRVFIGHLNTSECTKKDLEELFGPYGKISGVNMQHGYGFVQYDNEESVKEAIKKCHNTTFMGSRIVVDRPVALRRLEETDNREQRERKDLLEELVYLRRRDEYYRRHLQNFDRRDTRRADWDHYPPDPHMPPPASYYGGGSSGGGRDYGGGERAGGDRYRSGGGGGGIGGGAGAYEGYGRGAGGDGGYGGVGGGGGYQPSSYDRRGGDYYSDPYSKYTPRRI